MALYARIENGVVVERRHFETQPPAHKSFWKPVVDNGPPAVHVGQFYTTSDTINADNVTVAYTVQKRPTDELVPMIKAECQRRIMALVGASSMESCVTKQLNALKRASALTDKRVLGQALTAEEEAEATALRHLGSAIDALRDRSNALELSLPTDFDNNAHWS